VAGRCIPAPAVKAGEEMIELLINGQRYDKDNIRVNVVVNATKTLAALASAEEVFIAHSFGFFVAFSQQIRFLDGSK
jgi:hypothetical protein